MANGSKPLGHRERYPAYRAHDKEAMMPKRKRAPGVKFGNKEMRNKEADVMASEPILEEARKAGWRGGKAAFVSPEGHDIEKLLSGEEKMDWSKGQWVFPKKRDVPNLIDMLLHSKGDKASLLSVYQPGRLKLLQAQRFILDASASRFYGEVTMSWARQAIMQHELARAPYDLCWIEVDCEAYSTQVPTTQGPGEDLKVGYLCDHGTVYVASMSEETTNNAMFLPYRVVLNTPVSQEEEQDNAKFLALSLLEYRTFLMGTFGVGTRADDVALWTSPEVVNICRSHRFEFEPTFKERTARMPAAAKHQLVAYSTGILKQVIILLLLLTRPNKHVYFGEAAQPVRRVWMRNQQVPTVSYTKLTMHLQQKDEVRRIVEGLTGRHHKDHGVKQHWCQSRKKGRGCEHKFVLTDPHHGECANGCGAKIWWRKPHRRGDIALGTVSKSYEVTE